MKRIVLSHPLYEDGMALLAKQTDVEVRIANSGERDKQLALLRDADAFILRIGRVDADMMLECPELKVITRPGVGVDTIDVDCATARGIPVVVTPGANSRSVAEHAMTLLFALAKDLTHSQSEAKAGNYGVRNEYAAFELEGKTLGVLGFGNIGRIVASMAAALDMRVLVYDPFVAEGIPERMGYARAVTLEQALSGSDAVTLHMLSNEQTRGMIGERELSQMREGALLVNCARGDLVREDALYEALRSGHLAGAAEDMMVAEPFDVSSPLLTLPNFVATPHMAALTRESAARSAVMAVEGTLAVLRGERWLHVFCKDVYAHERWK